jgi:hypothetical protein
MAGVENVLGFTGKMNLLSISSREQIFLGL